MQEHLQHKTVTLSTTTTKMTAKVLLKLIKMYLAHQKNKKLNPDIPQGKQTVKQLAKQNQGMTSVEIDNGNIKAFERVARKYGVDFALKKDATQTPPKFLVFFKAKDQDAITAAFTEFSAQMIKKASRPSVLAQLRDIKEKIKDIVVDKVKHKDKEQSL